MSKPKIPDQAKWVGVYPTKEDAIAALKEAHKAREAFLRGEKVKERPSS